MHEFLKAIRDRGYEPQTDIEPGKFYRYPGAGKGRGNQAGWCILFRDGLAGVYGDFSVDKQWNWFIDSARLSECERDTYQRQIKAAERSEEYKHARYQQEALAKVLEQWTAALPCEHHPYLTCKGIKSFGLRLLGDLLLIPVMVGDEIISLQKISSMPDDNGKFPKWFQKDAHIRGGYFMLGEPKEVIYLVEGYATGASIHEATGEAVAIAFNAGNLRPASEALIAQYSDSKLKVAADHDESKIGEKKALETGLEVLLPPEIGDWNDYHLKHGLGAVRELVNPSDPLSWVSKYKVTDEEMDEIANPEFIIDGFIVAGHVHMICAKANAGKTTILFHLAGEIVKQGYRVIYVHADTSAGDSKHYHQKARVAGVELLLPDMKIGLSMNHVIEDLERTRDAVNNLSKVVFIFDTYKKMADAISKNSNKRMLGLLRGLTGKQATLICLHHTNKYDIDGKPIFEGTGDVRNDVDDLIYLIPDKQPDGSLVVSTVPDKQRADLKEMTFRISPDREVTLASDYHDLLSAQQHRVQLARDQDVVERVTEAIRSGYSKQCDIVEYCAEHGIGKNKVAACLKRYREGEQMLWRYERTREFNAVYYHLMDKCA